MAVDSRSCVSLYVHWPFCAFKCPYCDFNSHVTDAIDHDLWRDRLIEELDSYREYLSDKVINTLFFGGGTPSLAAPRVISGIIEHVAKRYSLYRDAEITMEANPTSVEAANFEFLAQNGVGRVSLGVQSFEQEQLAFLGRKHSATEARKAIRLADKFFPRYSFDLIYALPGQTVSHWSAQLQEALELANGHLSLYQLTIEKGTKFFDLYRKKKFALPDEEVAADMYIATENLMVASGYRAYEVSNYSTEGQECRHNLKYWRMGDYLGIGPGAHGRITQGGIRYAIQNISSPRQWLESVALHQAGKQTCVVLLPEQQEQERVIMGLRMAEGITLPPELHEKAAFLVDIGLLSQSGDTYHPTLQGRLLLNSVINNLLS